MKPFNKIITLCFISLFFAACTTEEPASLDPSLHNTNTGNNEETITIPQSIATTYNFPQDSSQKYYNDFKFTVDGEEKLLAFKEAYVKTSNPGNITTLTLVGLKDGKSVTLRLPPVIAANNTLNPYSLGDVNTSYVGYYSPAVNKLTVATSGQLNIAQHNTTDKVIIGNFKFDSTTLGVDPAETHTITEGYFKIWYGYQN